MKIRVTIEELRNYLYSPKTPASELSKFAAFPDEMVRMTVASHSNTPTETLELLSKDADETVRAQVARNPLTRTFILVAMAENERSVKVVINLVGNPNFPKEAIAFIDKDTLETVNNIFKMFGRAE